jgi:UDPglucose--hexose-1-phosphate uridylyltransferase
VWPFEVLVLSKRRVPSLLNFDEAMARDLADMYRRVTCRYDNLFTTLFPYSMGIHQAPVGDGPEAAKNHPLAHFHMHFYPPLLRSATVRKFMVGFEMMGEAQRDLTAEQAAARLLACSEVHYSEKKTSTK